GVRYILDGETIMRRNTAAERRRYDLAREERGSRRWSSDAAPWPVCMAEAVGHHLPGRKKPISARNERQGRHTPGSRAQATPDVERDAAQALHHHLPTDVCHSCRQNVSMAKAGIYVLILS